LADAEYRAEVLREMLAGEAWQFVQDYIGGRITYHTRQLLSCDMEEVPKHRAKVEAFNSVLLFIQDAIEYG